MYPPNTNKKFHPTNTHRKVLYYVQHNPGCNKWHAAKAGTRSALRSPHKQYYLVDTLIRQGYIRAEKRGNQYRLYYWESPIADTPPMETIPENMVAWC